jgi:RHS repeat-associated protein
MDYYPFGMGMPGRKYALGNGYRYGFNGKENDNEVKGEGNQQDYGMRIYDPRVGRFLSVDPITKKNPELTPYQFASNRPIEGIELIKSVTNPKNYKMVTVNTETGTLFDGNTRIYELQRRKLNVDVPYQEYTPDNSMFPILKEPPKK